MATTRPALSPETASATLQELWVFPVAPEVCNLARTHCLYAASPQRKNSYRLTEEEVTDLFGQLDDLGATPNLMFTDGEPTLHPHVCRLSQRQYLRADIPCPVGALQKK